MRRRAWIQNPIRVALNLKAEMDTMAQPDQAVLAQRHGWTRTRACQYLRLLSLPQDIVDFIAAPENNSTVQCITEGNLRSLMRLKSQTEVRKAFYAMLNVGQNDGPRAVSSPEMALAPSS